MFTPHLDLRAVVYQEGSLWLAHCLELDVIAQDSEQDPAVNSLVSLCDLQLRRASKQEARQILTPAPVEVWNKWTEGHEIRKFEAADLMQRIRHSHGEPYPMHSLDVRRERVQVAGIH